MGQKLGRLLFVSRYSPWPLVGGVRLRTYNNLRALSTFFDIDMVTVGSPSDELDKYCDNIVFADSRYGDETTMDSVARYFRAARSSIVTGQPVWISSKVSQELNSAVRRQLKERDYDAVHACELSVASLVKDLECTPIVYDSHNCEWQLLQQRATREPFPVSTLLFGEAKSLKRIEKDVLQRFQLVFATSATDRDELHTTAGSRGGNIHVASNSIDVDRYAWNRSQRPEPSTVIIPGTFTWRPNLVGLDWFLASVLPILTDLSAGNPMKIVVAGRMDDGLVRRLKNIPMVSTLPNPSEHDMLRGFAGASAVLVPVLVSSGTRLRILEAFASGRPIVTTSAGALGIHGEDQKHWMLADTAHDFARATIELIGDKALQGRLVDEGWKIVQQFDWRSVRTQLYRGYSQLLSRRDESKTNMFDA